MQELYAADHKLSHETILVFISPYKLHSRLPSNFISITPPGAHKKVILILRLAASSKGTRRKANQAVGEGWSLMLIISSQ